jgi:hypothetical protein
LFLFNLYEHFLKITDSAMLVIFIAKQYPHSINVTFHTKNRYYYNNNTYSKAVFMCEKHICAHIKRLSKFLIFHQMGIGNW